MNDGLITAAPITTPPASSPAYIKPERKIDLATYYHCVMAPRGFTLGAHHIPLCQALEDDRIQNLLFIGPAGTGKSVLLCQVYATWALGHDPTIPILSISAGERLPQTFMLAAMQILQHDPTFLRTFPDVRPDFGTGWSLDRGLFVTGHHAADENPNYFCCGLASKALTGLHARLMILDDLHDEENSRTPEARAEIVSRYYRTIIGRADARGCRRVAAGRWWAKDDLYQELIQSGDWTVLSLPASRPGNTRLWYDVFTPKGTTNILTEIGVPEPLSPNSLNSASTLDPSSRLALTGALADTASAYDHYRVYYGAADPLRQGFYWPAMPGKRADYSAVLRRQPRIAAVNWNGDLSASVSPVFTAEDFRPYVPPFPVNLLAQGRADPHVHHWIASTKGDVESAWDTAFGQIQSDALTVDMVGLFVPCSQWHRGEDPALVGACDFHYDVYLLDMFAESLDFRELALALRSRYGLWGPSRVTVEEKASGISLLQTFRASHIPIRGQRVAEGKIDRAINPIFSPGAGSSSRRPSAPTRGTPGVGGGAASVQGWCRMGRVLYPAGAAWTRPDPKDPSARPGWISRMLNFVGGTRNADEFDATVHLITRAIMRSIKAGRMPTNALSPGSDPTDPLSNSLLPFDNDPNADARSTLHAIAGLSALSTPAAAAATLSDPASNPYHGFCGGGCCHFRVLDNRERCVLHSRPTSSFDGCGDWAVTPPRDQRQEEYASPYGQPPAFSPP